MNDLDRETERHYEALKSAQDLQEHIDAIQSAGRSGLVVHREQSPIRDPKGRIASVSVAEWIETVEEHAKHRNDFAFSAEAQARDLRRQLTRAEDDRDRAERKQVQVEDRLERTKRERQNAEAELKSLAADVRAMHKQVERFDGVPKVQWVLPMPLTGESAVSYRDALELAERDEREMHERTHPGEGVPARLYWVTRK